MTAPDRILILGGTSAIATAYARQHASRGAGFILVGRHQERLAAVAGDLVARGATSAEPIVAKLAAVDEIAHTAKMIRSRFGDPAEIILAYGALADQDAVERDLAGAQSILEVNFTSAALWVLALFIGRDPAKPLTVVAIGSVAGDRGRGANILYGAAKGGLEIFIEGMRHKYGSPIVRFLVAKPGLVDTPMTAKFVKGGPLWASPERVAADIHRAVKRGRRVVYTPWFWRPTMAVIRILPWFVFKQLRI